MKTQIKFLLFMTTLFFLAIGCQHETMNPVDANSLYKEQYSGEVFLTGQLALIPYDLKEPDAWGKVDYNPLGSTLHFQLVAHNLIPNTYYALYALYSNSADDVQDINAQLFGYGISNNGGNINLFGSVDGRGLDNCMFSVWYCTEDGSKIWNSSSEGLVLHTEKSSGYKYNGN